MKLAGRTAGLVIGTFLLASCSWFGGDDDELEPAKLVNISNQIAVKKLWSAKLGGDAEFLRIALRPAGDVDRIYAASRDGNVSAYHPATGKQIWRTRLDLELSAGPGIGERLVVVSAADGDLIALDAASGTEHWRVNIGSESLAQPVIKDNLVIVLTIDNRLQALSVFDGSERWMIEQSTPLLTMRGSSTPVIVGSTVVAGFDNGRLAAVKLSSGEVEWEALLSPPTGRSDLERLSDVDGGLAVVGQDIYASGYQGQLAAIASESGQLLWSREISSFEGVSADWDNVYTVSDGGEIIAISRRTGIELWRNDSLLRREPTLPVSFHGTVVTGDLEGYVHFFSTIGGEPVARLKVGGAAITSEMVVVADRLYVQSDSGSLAAFAVQEARSRRNAPDIADQGS